MTDRPLCTHGIADALSGVFGCADVFDVQILEHTTVVMITSGDDRSVVLRFADMPRIAAALATDHLDFRSMAGADVIDSFSFNGCVLFIHAAYPPSSMADGGDNA